MSATEESPVQEPVMLTVKQTVLLLTGVLVVLFLAGYLLYSAVAWGLGWGRPTAAVPLPKPVIVSKELSFNFLAPHEVQVKVRNDGAAGLVRIELSSWSTSLEVKRSESGIEKSIRETFTTKLAPPPLEYDTKYHSTIEGSEKIWLEAGETKSVTVPLASYNWSDMVSGKRWSAVAYGIPPEQD